MLDALDIKGLEILGAPTIFLEHSLAINGRDKNGVPASSWMLYQYSYMHDLCCFVCSGNWGGAKYCE